MIYDMNFDEQIKAHGEGTIVSQSSIIVASMKQAVNKEALLSAIKKALLCHPLFGVKLIKKNGIYYWETNTKPVILRQYYNDHTLYFGNEDTNDYPWTIVYEEKKIYLTTTHALTDAYGMVKFFKTVLYYYYAYFDILIEDTSNIDTLENMNKETLHKSVELTNRVYGVNNSSDFQIKQPANLGVIDGTVFKNEEEPCSFFKVTLSKNEIEAYAKENKVTTFASLSAIFLKAMLPFVKNKEDNISISVAVDLRRLFGSQTMHNFVATLPLAYGAKDVENQSFTTLQQHLRADLTNDLAKENMEKTLYDMMMAEDMLMNNPAMLDYILQETLNDLSNTNANIVYTHVTKLDMPQQLEDLLENFEITGFVSYPTPLFIVMGNTFKDQINLTIAQMTKDDQYCKNICELLKQEELTFSCETTYHKTRLLFKTGMK